MQAIFEVKISTSDKRRTPKIAVHNSEPVTREKVRVVQNCEAESLIGSVRAYWNTQLHLKVVIAPPKILIVSNIENG
jgi:hypothetical protein